jgi:hypothetical protein
MVMVTVVVGGREGGRDGGGEGERGRSMLKWMGTFSPGFSDKKVVGSGMVLHRPLFQAFHFGKRRGEDEEVWVLGVRGRRKGNYGYRRGGKGGGSKEPTPLPPRETMELVVMLGWSDAGWSDG